MAYKSREERYWEWLERLDVPIEETTTKERFQEWLREQVHPHAYEAAKDILWEYLVERYDELAPMGVRPVVVRYWWGTELRWAIKGYPGLWGYKRMKEITGWEP